MVARGWGAEGNGQKAQTSSYKTRKFWGSNVHFDVYS